LEFSGIYTMSDFLRATFNGQKFQGLFINTALGNFAGYVAGSLVTVVSTRHAVEPRAISNLFGVVPRKQIVVHVLPHWLEWLLALVVGFLVMEAVRYWCKHRKYAVLLSALRLKRGTSSGTVSVGSRSNWQSGGPHDGARGVDGEMQARVPP
jgi:hypothetical protein